LNTTFAITNVPETIQNTTLVSEKNRVLLIEDNPGDARLVEILLEESDLVNCEITHHVTLTEGKQELEKGEEFAAVLLDLTLPDSRGFDTLKSLITRFPYLNVIVMTGLSDKALGLEAVKFGAQDFLVKGAFDADLLAKTLRYSIQRNGVLKSLEETQRLAHIGNWEYSPENQQFAASDETYRIFGLKPRQDVFSAEDILAETNPFHLFLNIHRETIAAGEELSKDIKIQHTDGTSHFVNIRCSVSLEGGSWTSSGVIQDITERKKSEQEIIKSRERYQHIFTKSKDAIYICTLEGKMIDFNEATTSLFGISKEELLGKEDMHTLFYPKEKVKELLLQLKTQRSVKDFPIEVTHKVNEVRQCLLTANLLVTEDFIGYNGILRDITELKQAEKLRKARDFAEQSAKMKEQFIASVSHEMRTPMNAILGMSNILYQMNLGEEQHNLVSSIKQSSEILLGIVNDILEVSTIQNGKVVFENKGFNIRELLDNMMSVMQYKAQEKDLYFQVIMDDSIPKILNGDKLRLSQILYNLVGNAIKFTDNGYVKVYVKKMNEILDSVQLKFIVEDTGIGIPEEKIDAVFETFTRIRTKERLFEGTGLGLSIAKNLVEQQGGKIGATSILGEGSKFFFDLLIEVGTESDTKIPENEEIDYDDNNTFKLLLVEDHKMNQLVARKTLERKFPNAELTIADNGQIAVEILAERTFDLVLMDIQMPIMDGYEATTHIRKNMPQLNDLPVLAMTAHAHIAKDKQYLEYGMDDYVLKPFKPEDLFYKIKKYITQGR
jgi:PAS domain S-box-containing protein